MLFTMMDLSFVNYINLVMEEALTRQLFTYYLLQMINENFL